MRNQNCPAASGNSLLSQRFVLGGLSRVHAHLVKADVDHGGHRAMPLDGIVGQSHHERIPALHKGNTHIFSFPCSAMSRCPDNRAPKEQIHKSAPVGFICNLWYGWCEERAHVSSQRLVSCCEISRLLSIVGEASNQSPLATSFQIM